MTNPDKNSANGGGFLIAACLLIGSLVGFIFGQPSIGFLTGLGIGSALAVAVWLRTRD